MPAIIPSADFLPDFRGRLRFFMGTGTCNSFWEALRDLVNKEWLLPDNPQAQVKTYQTTSTGQQLLAEGYSTERIKNYVMAIDSTGRILKYLEGIDERLGSRG